MPVAARDIATVRAFNRDYTRRIGILQESLLDSPYSLTEARVLYEIAHREGVTAAELANDLGLDRGYLSRILKKFSRGELVAQRESASDGRRRHLGLTTAGQRCFAKLNEHSEQQIAQMLGELDQGRLQAVLVGMEAIQGAFASPQAGPPISGPKAPSSLPTPTAAPTALTPTPTMSSASRAGSSPASAIASVSDQVTLRPHKPGDMGWIIERHGALYFLEYAWDERFEALVAQIASEFIMKLQPVRERCWIAERDGQRLGCIFLVSGGSETAKLRLLLVEPGARGLGVGRRLVGECIRFAREAGYREVVLWTQQNLSAARHLYTEAGFTRIAEEPHHSFGHSLIGETWQLRL
jgi:DNA-binding MarR family transcriptional regulator/GNAT superfamily N-acetyltransferase